MIDRDYIRTVKITGYPVDWTGTEDEKAGRLRGLLASFARYQRKIGDEETVNHCIYERLLESGIVHEVLSETYVPPTIPPPHYVDYTRQGKPNKRNQ